MYPRSRTSSRILRASQENILLDVEGHIRLVDFGFAKETKERTFTLCGTVDYLAPGTSSRSHTLLPSVDLLPLQKSFKTAAITKRPIGGRLAFSSTKCLPVATHQPLSLSLFRTHAVRLLGYPPFYDPDQFVTYQKILSGKITFPRHFDYAVKCLLRKLLNIDQAQRIGSAKNGGEEVKSEQWFIGVDWFDVYERKVEPPIRPVVTSPGDTTNFDSYDECDMKLTPAAARYEVHLFKDF